MYLHPDVVVRGHYQVIGELGGGGFGITYLAKDIDQLDDAPLVVIKQIAILQPDEKGKARKSNYLDDLEKEAQTLSLLKHDRIPKFIARFEEAGYFYIVQEYIEGQDLRQELINNTRINEQKAKKMLRDILEILDFVHSQNIIHRDIKPGNLIRKKSNQTIILIDFGAVKEIATRHTTAAGTVFTKVIGTPNYMPAEQLYGNPKFNSDIYAVGIILIQAITGLSAQEISALPRDNECNLIWEDLAHGISKDFKKIISKAIHYNHLIRYQSAQEILSDLEQLNNGREGKKSESETTEEIISKPIKKIGDNLFKKNPIIFGSLSIIILSVIGYRQIESQMGFQSACTQEIADSISCGEEILDPQSLGSIRKNGAKYYRHGNYQLAWDYFQNSWQRERRDAETLIYLNNSLLEAINADYYTIAVAVPLSSDENLQVNNSRLGQDFLRGIAQAQTEVNLNLLKSNQEIKATLPGQDFLAARSIDRSGKKGLKVVLIDDGNNQQQAQTTATTIASKSKILGVIGHYASEMTLATVDIYNQKKLAQISFGTTTKELSIYPRSNFFRVVYSNPEEAEAIVNYLDKIDIDRKKVAVFYNPSSDYSNYFWLELKDQLKQKNVEVVKGFNLASPRFNVALALKETKRLGANIFLLLPDGQVTDSITKAIEVIRKDNGNNMILGGNPLVNPKIETIETTQPLQLMAASTWHPLLNADEPFVQDTQQLWGKNIYSGTAMAYDAMVALIEAINQQNMPTRKGILSQLADPQFSAEGVTGEIKFNTPENGDRMNFMPTLVHLVACSQSNQSYCFMPIE